MIRGRNRAELATTSNRARGAGLSRTIGVSAVLLALMLGIQIGAVHWRYRRQIWQLQGLMAGLAIGYVVGRVGGGRQDDTPPR